MRHSSRRAHPIAPTKLMMLQIVVAGLMIALPVVGPIAVGGQPASATQTVEANGVAGFGTASLGGLSGLALSSPVVGMSSTPDGAGYWLVASDGGVFSFGDAKFHGSAGSIHLNQPVVGMTADPATGGYWLVTADGGVFSYDAHFFGSAGGSALNAPVVGIAATKDGGGYWLVASDGGVFAYGDAKFDGSLGGTVLNRPVVGIDADISTGGYWLVTADGGVFSYNAHFFGSAGNIHLADPVLAMAATAGDGGYLLLGADGGVFTYGNAVFEGSDLSSPGVPAVGIAVSGPGYWVAYGQTPAVDLSGAQPSAVAASPNGGAGTFGPTSTGVLTGKIVTIDPGHNGNSWTDPAYLNAPIWNGVEEEACDTTGSATDGGYTEARFNFNVAEYLAADLRSEGATVVLTRTTNAGVGPCVTERAAIGNNAHSDAALSIHADGGPPGGRGFVILEPVADGINNAVIAPSDVLGTDLRNSFEAGTGEPVSSYDGTDGIQPRNNLGGINLTTVPKVFVECANMRNSTDAALVVSSQWQEEAANSIANGLTTFLT